MSLVMVLSLLLLLLAGVLLFGLFTYKKAVKKVAYLEEILAIKEQTISNLEASRVSVKSLIQALPYREAVLKELQAHLSREEIAKRLGVEVSVVENVLKIEALLNA